MRDGQRFNGDARNIYLSFFSGDLNAKFRFVVCDTCVEALTEEWLGRALHRDAQGRWADAVEGETLEDVLEASTGLPAGFTRKNGH